MTPRRRWVWIGYWGGVALLSLVLVGVTLQVLVFESGEALLRAQRQRQEAVRLALWRMDSWLAPLLAREARRPYFEYRAVLPVGRSYEAMWAPVAEGEPVTPSPLALAKGEALAYEGGIGYPGESSGLVRLHVQIEPDGTVSSPQFPSDADLARLVVDDPGVEISVRARDRAGTVLGVLSGMLESRPMDDGVWARAEDEFSRAFGPVVSAGRTPEAETTTLAMGIEPGAKNEYDDSVREYGLRSNVQQLLNRPQLPTPSSQASYELARDAQEPADDDRADRSRQAKAADDAVEEQADSFAQRETARREALADGASETRAQPLAGAPAGELEFGEGDALLGTLLTSSAVAAPPPVEVGPLAPVWLEPEFGVPELLYLRRVEAGGSNAWLQGVWLDWETLEEQLLEQGGLGDGAALRPVLGSTFADDPARRLAAVPAVLRVGEVTAPSLGMTPARWSLLLTWAAVIASVAAIGVVLRTAMRLSDRRVRFVGAVTHELRTPLTTFRLYSQMLADGMVTEEASRREYLSTLKEESGRLAGIVENVLAYARLNRAGRNGTGNGGLDRTESISPDRLLARLLPALSRRAEQSGMDLIVSNEAAGVERALQVDPQSVERILTNLVDNACKYAPPPADGEGHDDATAETRIHLDVRIAGDTLEILVADYGPGIDPADRARVFGEFQRGRAGQRADRSGLGLGLALSRGLARESGGDLRLTRRRGHGAEFLLVLPLQPERAGV